MVLARCIITAPLNHFYLKDPQCEPRVVLLYRRFHLAEALRRIDKKRERILTSFNSIILKARYLILPFCVILVLGIVLLLFQASLKLLYLFGNITSISDTEILIGLFSIIDLALLANILLLIALSGYDSFISRLNENAEGIIGLDALDGLTLAKVKLKLLGSMIVISAIGLLSTFLSMDHNDGFNQTAYVQIAIHIVLSLSAVLLAFSDKLDKK